MKQIVYPITLLILLLFGACRNENEFKLKGEITNLTCDTLSLYGILGFPDSLIKMPVKDGKFQCVMKMDTLTPLYLWGDSLGYEIPIFADKGLTITVEGDALDPEEIQVEGGKYQEEYNRFTAEARSLKDSKAVLACVDSFVIAHPQSLVSVYLIDKYYVQIPTPNNTAINRMINCLSGNMQDNPYVNRLLNLVKNGSSVNSRDRYLPFINLPDSTRKMVTAADVKDRIVVVTLWASWHQESIALQDSLKKFQKEFEIGRASCRERVPTPV